MPDKIRIAVTVNGTAHDVLVEPRTLLLDFLRDQLALTGAHAGCEQGACGACTVLVDGELLQAVGALAASATDPVGDCHGSAAFRRHLAAVLTRRALATAISRAEERNA